MSQITISRLRYAELIFKAIFAAMRIAAPKVPGATPEFLKLHMETLDMAEGTLHSALPFTVAALDAAEVKVDGLS